MADEPNKNSSSDKSRMPLHLSIGVLGGAVIAYFFIPQVRQFFNEAWSVLTSDDEERIRSWVGLPKANDSHREGFLSI